MLVMATFGFVGVETAISKIVLYGLGKNIKSTSRDGLMCYNF